MIAKRTRDGLYTFPLTLTFKNLTRTFTGLVDTGSNICACTYQIPVTLRARATSFEKINSPIAEPIRALGYSMNIGFDGKSVMTHVYRLNFDMPGIDFILGLSVLSQCTINIEKDSMNIVWQ